MAGRACDHCNDTVTDLGDIMDDECNEGKKICKWCDEMCNCDLVHLVR